jgi:ankyrin repeat protein
MVCLSQSIDHAVPVLQQGKTALHFAAEKGHIDLARELITVGGRELVMMKDVSEHVWCLCVCVCVFV